MLLKKIKHPADVGTSNLAVKSNFLTWNAEADKQKITKLVNVPTGLSYWKTKVDDLDAGKLKTILKDLKKLSNKVSEDGVKKTN